MNAAIPGALLLLLAHQAVAHQAPPVPEPMSLEDLTASVNWDLDGATITTQKISDELYVLFGTGGNIAASIGEDGVLLVDDQFPQLMPKIKAALKALGNGEVDFAINTHWHFDHADGNLALGPAGTWLVSQTNSREMMKQDNLINLVFASYEQKAYPPKAWPVITFDTSMQFHFNGEQIDLLHFGPAHTTGDAVVIFGTSNAVHLGDVFNYANYPFIDVGNGGDLDGVIRFCNATLARINEDTTVIPGHGPVTDRQALVDYVSMLTTIRDRMLVLIEQGASLQDVYDAEVTREWDERFGDSTGFVNRAYMSLTHKIVDK